MEIFLISLIYTHISSAIASIYLHRCVAHKLVKYVKPLEIVFQVWVWMTFKPFNRYKIAYHRVHHAYADTEVDPHSPIVMGRFKMLVKKPVLKVCDILFGSFKIQQFTDKMDIIPFLSSTPDTGFTFKFPKIGPWVFLSINVFIFGIDGFFIWMSTLIMINVGAYTFNDGFGHTVGYTNFTMNNHSRNYFPLGIFFAGEELHNNHHYNSNRLNFAVKWYEFDLGFQYIKILKILKLAKIQ